MTTHTHDFNERNAWSLQARQEAFWEAVYQKAFPSIVKCELIKDLANQKNGVDRLLTLANDITLTIDEKTRERADTGDILLEYKHEGLYNAPGWIEKDLTIDYLAYAFIPNRRCYLFDWRMLRRAWVRYKDVWMVQHRHVVGQNQTYKTWSIAVPTDVLQRAVLTASVIEV